MEKKLIQQKLKRQGVASGFVGFKAKESFRESMVFGVEEMGRGSIVYMADNPLFRGFWYNGKLLFSNAH